VLEEAVGQLFKRGADVLGLISLPTGRTASSESGRAWRASRERAPCRRRSRRRERIAGGRGRRLASSKSDAVGDHGLFAAGGDRQEIFLTIVEEAKIPRGPISVSDAAGRI
jgi:hypothetical protein